ncbi:MAG: MFS transporter [Pirellulaceae bacterium]|nr:MFS transporter [Pirellulaceae bacterium]
MINQFSDRLSARLPFFYGYVMIPVAMLIQICTSPGQTFAVSAFTPALRESLQLSDSRFSFAYMVGTFLAAFPLSVIGPLADRWGNRVVTFVVSLSLALTCWLASHVSGFVSLLIVFFLLRFLGQGSMSLLGGNAIAMWFRTRIGRVSAAMSVGGAIAFAWVPQWISTSISIRGWRATYQALAIVVVVAMLPTLIFLFRNRPEDLGQHVDGIDRVDQDDCGQPVVTVVDNEPRYTLRQAMRHHSFYLLGLINCFWALTGTGIVFYLFTLCEDRGLASRVPADLFKTLGFSMLALQLIGGVLADALPLNRLLGVGTTLLCIGLGFAWLGDTTPMMHGFAFFFGGGQGLLLAVGSVVWVRYYGRIHLGSIRGAVWSLTVAGSGCGPLAMGLIRDRYLVFDHALGIFFAIMSVLAALSWFATAPRGNP